MAHKAINQETWPEYLRLEIKPTNSRLQNRGNCKIEISSDKNTFRSNAGAVFNNLPAKIREEKMYIYIYIYTYISQTKNYFKDKAVARTL